jgi:hypothetical protein
MRGLLGVGSPYSFPDQSDQWIASTLATQSDDVTVLDLGPSKWFDDISDEIRDVRLEQGARTVGGNCDVPKARRQEAGLAWAQVLRAGSALHRGIAFDLGENIEPFARAGYVVG